MPSEFALCCCSRIPLSAANQLKPCRLFSSWNSRTTACSNDFLGPANKICMKLQPRGRFVRSVVKENVGYLRISRRLIVGGAVVLPFMMMWMGGGEGSAFSAYARPRRSEVEEVLKNVEWPEKFPFKDEDFQRFDESPDSLFYSDPRFVTHIDDPAINALTKYYSMVFPPSNTPGVSLLDMCSSWVSHYPRGYKQDRIVGMGMNEEEIKQNPVLTEYVVQDLNVNPQIPLDDGSFDIITNVVSVDYLTRPLDVFKEMRRVLKPGGLAIMSFSNRCFWTKAISIWTSTGDADHAFIVGSYFHYTGGFEPPEAVDISPNPGRSDPMYVVFARKAQA